ncbi:hypothetical protein Tco_0388194, partial [Tanacetum coccineum]
VPATRECTNQDFLKCQPPIFKGNKGVVGLTRWIEKMKTVFHISNCPLRYQVKYASCTLQNGALAWCSLCHDVEGTHEADDREEEDRVEKFIRGLLDNIQGNVIVAAPTRL